VPQAGHNPLSANLADCAAALWPAMLAGQSAAADELERALTSCTWPTRVTAFAAGD
jgi:hypothetical protein